MRLSPAYPSRLTCLACNRALRAGTYALDELCAVLTASLRFGPMVADAYHEAVWASVPEGAQPADARLRRAFLLERVAAIVRRDDRRGEGGVRVLDVGCGDGRLTAELERVGVSVVGVDVAAEALRRARETNPGLRLGLIPAEGPWPLDDSSFDVVWAGDTIEHVADTAAWLSEVRRVLRSGGTLLLSTPAHDRLTLLALALRARRFDAHFDPRSDHLRFYTARTLRRLLEDFRFEGVELRRAGGLPGARRLLLASARRARF